MCDAWLSQGGVVSKKASREQATLTVDVHTGMVELTVLGKNGMMWRPEEDQPWTHLPRSGTARLRTHSEFSLLGRIGARVSPHLQSGSGSASADGEPRLRHSLIASSLCAVTPLASPPAARRLLYGPLRGVCAAVSARRSGGATRAIGTCGAAVADASIARRSGRHAREGQSGVHGIDQGSQHRVNRRGSNSNARSGRRRGAYALHV
jgi:hypothetical protein